jgi:1-deoxy-D-xylulose 5-phosphate reductoisomerase
VAVHAFLRGELPFTGIPRVIEATLATLPAVAVRHFSDLYEADAHAREVARSEATAVAREVATGEATAVARPEAGRA